MKKIVYDSKLAHLILWANYSTITLTAFVFTEFKNKNEMPQSVRNHECTHAHKDISFEKEAKASENDNCYLENMGYFEWFKYYGKNF